ncbi:hypothetical protein AL532_27245 [Pseudomonas monteilii]|uniref:Uncharacterized protein n=1 Tax=Pseudomonas kurunegalensis TaxID=485880 RepID=A0ACC5UP84_9PSED|nr:MULTISPECIES: hypothetical protein [Pseudomonas]AVH39734.1 hypothetical protein AL532_27245 [Pseudomonas monteilii]MBV4516180.1 hypothetical protein [Pseudomonas kurunegalensis]
MTPENAKLGQVKVHINSKVNFGGTATPIEIRNDDLVLIISAISKRVFELPVGVYEISAVLEDGNRQKQTVEITESKIADVWLEPKLSYQPEVPELTLGFLSAEKIQALKPPAQNVKLIGASRNVTIYPKGGFWIVRHRAEMEQVAYAIIQKDEELYDISLPISAGNHHLSVTCHIEIATRTPNSQLQVSISRSRSLSAALETTFMAGKIDAAARLAGGAVNTLMNTYVDPTGAILAALILKKAGRLNKYRRQLEQITAEFPWLPDAKVLLATILIANPDERDKAIQLAYEASQERILYTESFSILMSLLRYAPETDNIALCKKALTNIAKIAPEVDWSSIYLCKTFTDNSNA